MDTLELKKSFIRYAQTLGDYQEMTKTELAEGYCTASDEKDEALRSAYFSALMLRYWFKLKKTKDKNPKHLTDENCYDIVIHGLQYALENRAWKDPTKDVYEDPNGPDKVINRCIDSSYLIYQQTSNKDVRKINGVTYSLDANVEENGDSALDNAGAYVEPEATSGAKELVNAFIENNKFIEALLIDGIAFQDSFKEESYSKDIIQHDAETGEEVITTVKGSIEGFDKRKLIKHLTNINEKFMTGYFNVKYDISEEVGGKILSELQALPNAKLYKYVENILIKLQHNKSLLNYLIN